MELSLPACSASLPVAPSDAAETVMVSSSSQPLFDVCLLHRQTCRQGRGEQGRAGEGRGGQGRQGKARQKTGRRDKSPCHDDIYDGRYIIFRH